MSSAGCPRDVSRMREAIAGDPRDRPILYTARGGSKADVNCGRSCHRLLTAAWEELGLWLPLTVLNALEHPMWKIL